MISLLLHARDQRHVAVYTIHEPPSLDLREVSATKLDRAEALELVRDGFTWNAMLMPPAFFLGHKMWAELSVYLLTMVIGVVVLLAIGLSPNLVFVLLAAAHIWLGFEAVDLQREAMSRAGWTMLGSVSGRNQAECERRFFDSWLASDSPVIASSNTAPPAGTAIGELEKRLTGLFGRFSRLKT